MKKILNIFILLIMSICLCLLTSCTLPKGKYFVEDNYIIATANLTGISTNTDTGKIEYYMIDICHDSDIKLNAIKYKCDLYLDGKIIETFENEVPMNGLYSKYIPLQTTKEYDHAKVICTGWSDENPENFVKLKAKKTNEMRNCKHNNLISAKITSHKTNSKNDYITIYFSSTSAYGDFRFFYEEYKEINFTNVKVCTDCGFYVSSN